MTSMDALWPWLTFAGLGAFHGLNPSMGWLFAVALGLHRGSRQALLLSLAPIALGHALSVWPFAAAMVIADVAVDAAILRAAAGAALIGWALYHWRYGRRHRVRVGMTTSLGGLVLWSFLMATTHGAGLMLVPALMPLCGSEAGLAPGSFLVSFAAVGVHTLAMLAVIAAIAFCVYEWIGVMILRRSWINFDFIWTGMLAAAGAAMLVSSGQLS